MTINPTRGNDTPNQIQRRTNGSSYPFGRNHRARSRLICRIFPRIARGARASTSRARPMGLKCGTKRRTRPCPSDGETNDMTRGSISVQGAG